MKINWATLAFSLRWSFAAAKSQPDAGHVFLYDPRGSLQSSSNSYPSVSLESARLIIAERLGLSRFYSLGDLSQAAVQQLNEFSRRRHYLFDNEKDDELEHALIIVEGVKDPEKLWPKSKEGWSRFQTSEIPSALENRRLLGHFQSQADSLYTEKSEGVMQTKTFVENLRFWKSNDQELLTTSGSLTFRHIQTLQQYVNDPKGTYTSMSENLILHIERLVRVAKSEGFPLTILLMPPSSSETENQPAGVWGEPASIARRQQPEVVLSSKKSSTTKTSIASSSVPTGPVRGILPSCFSTEQECNTITHGCSGHGKCVLKYKGSKGKTSDCFTCACEPEKIRDGKKTINYGGPACQKKDVVVPFWLLAGSSIALITIVSMGIGLLYSMGSEELPSVIGAGVSGPRSK